MVTTQHGAIQPPCLGTVLVSLRPLFYETIIAQPRLGSPTKCMIGYTTKRAPAFVQGGKSVFF